MASATAGGRRGLSPAQRDVYAYHLRVFDEILRKAESCHTRDEVIDLVADVLARHTAAMIRVGR